MKTQKEFHTKTEYIDEKYIVRYIAAEDFIEMGSIAGEQYFSAVRIGAFFRKERTPELFKPHLEFLEKSIKDFIQKNGLEIKKYPSFRNSNAGFYQMLGWEGYDSLMVTIFNDYRNIWITLREVSHQTFYPEYDHSFTADYDTLKKVIQKSKILFIKYPEFSREIREGDIRD